MATSSTANDATVVGHEAPAPGTPGGAADFAAIYEANSRAVYYLALRLLGDATRAEDAAHDVFLKAFR
ncbi:MAG TPA: sigma factor, partial [Chthoniobacteraceae bacterium]|nr:sigma factor [Chthoniobacteraceae bacterium]